MAFLGYGFAGILYLVALIWLLFETYKHDSKIKKDNKIWWTIFAIIPGVNIIAAIAYIIMYKMKK
jgi:hypothetical protein